MEVSDILQSLFRWIHTVAGVIWIGHLYFFNFVNAPFAGTMDGETKKKVVPQLMPRALFWFRWAAAYTWVTGLLLLLLIFHHGGALFEDAVGGWGIPAIVMILVTFAGPFLYDLWLKHLWPKNSKVAVIAGFVLLAGIVCLYHEWAGFGFRGYNIYLGTLFGTIMAYNVWFKIWPFQQKIITAVKNGETPDAVLVAQAGLRSRHNAYFSVPLIWTMLNIHTFWTSSTKLYLFAVITISAVGMHHLLKKATKVQGF